MKMYEIMGTREFCLSIKDQKLPLKTAYKLSRLAHRLEQETQFYNEEFTKIIEEYARKENGQLVYSADMTSIEVIPGKEKECNEKINELQNLEVDLGEFEFDIEEFDGLNLTLVQMNSILPLIRN
jgi:hypothetical protein